MTAKAIVMLALLGLTACDKTPIPPTELRRPDPKLLAPPVRLAVLPTGLKADGPVWESYGQCRMAYANEADLRSGLVSYVVAMLGKP